VKKGCFSTAGMHSPAEYNVREKLLPANPYGLPVYAFARFQQQWSTSSDALDAIVGSMGWGCGVNMDGSTVPVKSVLKYYRRPDTTNLATYKKIYPTNDWESVANVFNEAFFNPAPTVGDIFATDWEAPPTTAFLNSDLIVCHNVSGAPTLTSYKGITMDSNGQVDSQNPLQPKFTKLTPHTSPKDPFVDLSPDTCNDPSVHEICAYCQAKIVDANADGRLDVVVLSALNSTTASGMLELAFNVFLNTGTQFQPSFLKLGHHHPDNFLSPANLKRRIVVCLTILSTYILK